MRGIVLFLAVVVAGFVGTSCGSSDEDSTFSDGGNGGGSASGGTGGIDLDGGGGTAGGASGTGGGVGDLCGGKPCANYTGDKEFSDGNAPGNSAGLFDGGSPGSDPNKEPAVVYPSHETMFPVNVSHIRHDWTGGTGNDLYRLEFKGPKTTVKVYSTNLNWEPDDEAWDWIAESNRGNAVTLTVSALSQATPETIYVSAPITLYFSDSEVEGAIYYWSTGTAGVMKALVSDKIPVKFYTDPTATDSGTCVACHTLSRDGKRLAVGYGGEKLKEVDVPDRKALVPATGAPSMASSWTTFSPDGKLLLVANSGKLTLIDSDTGAPVGPNAGVVPIPTGKIATHPDWNALGDTVVIALGTNGGNKDVEGGSIALLPYNNGAWGPPTNIVTSSGTTDNNFFPVWSPDSKWIAYVNAKTKSKDAVTAKLMLLPAAGGTPVELTRLNQRVNNQNGVVDVGNSMPTWAPSTKPGIFWLAFSSLRAYATVRPQDAKEDQIWIAAIDPGASDPGYAGFWAPFQSIEEGNHRAFWTHTDTDVQCLCTDLCGDGLDNDCDGVADESGCTASCGPIEICGNGLDDDCDCVVDDCVKEICGNGIDDDGDGHVDNDDPECFIPK